MKLKQFNAAFLVALSGFTLVGCGGGGGGPINIVQEEVTPEPIGSAEPESIPVTNQNFTGVDTWHENGFTGQNTKVALLDSYSLTENESDYTTEERVAKRYNVDPNLENSTDGFAVDEEFDEVSNDVHGDNMAQIIGSNREGIGMAPDTSILHGVISDGITTQASIWKGVEWANENNVVATNISFGYAGTTNVMKEGLTSEDDEYLHVMDDTISEIMDNVITTGMAVVYSAGNEAENLSNVATGLEEGDLREDLAFSRMASNLILVGGVTDENELTEFSNFPGGNEAFQRIFLLSRGYQNVYNGDTEMTIAGTSGAAASVTGAMAAMKSRWQDLTGKELRDILLETSNKDFDGYDPFYHGQGIMDLAAAYSPVGGASIVTQAGKVVPVRAASVNLPAGFEAKSYKASFVDGYDRDFSATFTTGSKEENSNHNYKMLSQMNNQKGSVVARTDDALIAVKESFTGYENDTDVVGFDSFSGGMFDGTRKLQTVALMSKGVQVELSTNLADQLNSSQDKDAYQAAGYKAKVGYKGLDVEAYVANEDAGHAFYGSQGRDSTGLKVAYQAGPVKAGASVSTQDYKGSEVVEGMSMTSQSMFVDVKLINARGFSAGVVGQVENADVSVAMNLPQSVGNGALTYQKAEINSGRNSVATGAYVKAGDFMASVYQDDLDTNLTVGYKAQF